MASPAATLSYAADLVGSAAVARPAPAGDALRLADLAGAPAEDRAATNYTGLLMNTYCHADATEQARWFGDDITFKGDMFGLPANRRHT